MLDSDGLGLALEVAAALVGLFARDAGGDAGGGVAGVALTLAPVPLLAATWRAFVVGFPGRVLARAVLAGFAFGFVGRALRAVLLAGAGLAAARLGAALLGAACLEDWALAFAGAGRVAFNLLLLRAVLTDAPAFDVRFAEALAAGRAVAPFDWRVLLT